MQGEDLVTPEGLEEGLEAPVDDAPHGPAVGLDVADAGRPLDRPNRRGSEEADVDLVALEPRVSGGEVHGHDARERKGRCDQCNH